MTAAPFRVYATEVVRLASILVITWDRVTFNIISWVDSHPKLSKRHLRSQLSFCPRVNARHRTSHCWWGKRCTNYAHTTIGFVSSFVKSYISDGLNNTDSFLTSGCMLAHPNSIYTQMVKQLLSDAGKKNRWPIGPLDVRNYSLFTIHYSLFTIHYSLFTIHYSLFTIHYSLFRYAKLFTWPAYALRFLSVCLVQISDWCGHLAIGRTRRGGHV
jgi:hypothetical protein